MITDLYDLFLSSVCFHLQIEKDKIEEGKKLGEQDVVRLMNEKEASDRKISELQLDLEATKKSYEIQCQRLEAKSNQIKGELEKNVKELEFLLAESRKKTRELEEVSELKFKSWNHKQHIFQEIMGSQLQKMQVYHVYKVTISLLCYL